MTVKVQNENLIFSGNFEVFHSQLKILECPMKASRSRGHSVSGSVCQAIVVVRHESVITLLERY